VCDVFGRLCADGGGTFKAEVLQERSGLLIIRGYGPCAVIVVGVSPVGIVAIAVPNDSLCERIRLGSRDG
jgi:hypothetical protein